MPNFNPAEYADVNERIAKFYQDHKDGRILTDISEHTPEYVIIKASVHVEETLRATGYAQEFREFEKAKTKEGKEYEPVNMFNYLENCETSAIGRALANYGYSGSKRPSKQEMDKVDRMQGARPASSARPVSDKQKELANKLLKDKVPAEKRKEFLISTIGTLAPANSAEASKLIEALVTYKANNEEA